jgi:hypothetical protein
MTPTNQQAPPDEAQTLRQSIVHGLRMHGWDRVDAECEALARLERIAAQLEKGDGE